MSRPLLLFGLLVLLPGLVLATLAIRVADWDRQERLRALADDLDLEARSAARRVEEALSAAVARAPADAVVAYASGGRWLGYAGDPAKAEASGSSTDAAVDAGDLAWYGRSVRGGESWELALGDPARALDAYAFWLPRIGSPELRGRLRLRAARAALATAAGRAPQSGTGRAAPDPDRALGLEILGTLLEDARGLSSDEGLPIDLLAATLIERSGGPESTAPATVRARLLEDAARLETPALAAFAAELAPGDREIASLLASRRALEGAVAARPEALSASGAVLVAGGLVLSSPATPGAGDLLAVRWVPVVLAPIDAGDLIARLQLGGPGTPDSADAGSRQADGWARAPVLLRELATPSGDRQVVASVRVEDPAFPAKLAALDRRRALQRGLVGGLFLIALGGGAALVRYILRERELTRLRTKLLRNVTHELKTPVTSIRMLSEMLAGDPLSEEQGRRFAALVAAESSRLGRIFDDFLDVSRPGGSDDALPLEPVDLALLLAPVAEAFGLRAARDGVRFEAEGVGPAAAGIVLETSPAAVERIVLNLLDNALKYRGKEAPEVRLRVGREGAWATASVRDNGPGIPREHRERIFEELFRLRYDDYAVTGSGLGLAISRRLARRLGGDVTLETEEGKGSEFTLRLPIGGGGHGGH